MGDRPDGCPRRHWFGSPAAAYAALVPLLARAAREAGYALGVHGSMGFDLDLIACPWVDDAIDAQDLIRTLCDAIALDPVHCSAVSGPASKPHGRVAWVIPLGSGLALDVSVTPREEASHG